MKQFWAIFVIVSLLVPYVGAATTANTKTLPTKLPDIESEFTKAAKEARDLMDSLPLILARDPDCTQELATNPAFQEKLRQLLPILDEADKKQLMTILEANRWATFKNGKFVGIDTNVVKAVRDIVQSAGPAREIDNINRERELYSQQANSHVGQTNVRSTNAYIVGSASWGGDKGTPTDWSLEAGGNIAIHGDANNPEPIGQISPSVVFRNGQITQMRLGVNTPIGEKNDPAIIQAELLFARNAKGGFAFQELQASYQYGQQYLKASHLKDAKLSFDVDNQNRFRLKSASVNIGLPGQSRQISAEYEVNSEGKTAVKQVHITYKNDGPIIKQGENAGFRVAELGATFRIDGNTDDPFEEFIIVMDAEKRKINQDQTQEKGAQSSLDKSVDTVHTKANRFVFRYGSAIGQARHLGPALGRALEAVGFKAKKVVTLAYSAANTQDQTTNIRYQEASYDELSDVYKVFEKTELYNERQDNQNAFLVVFDPQDLDNSLFLAHVKKEKETTTTDAVLAFDGTGFRGLTLEYQPERLALSRDAEAERRANEGLPPQDPPNDGFQITAQNYYQTLKSPVVNRLYLSVLPREKTTPASSLAQTTAEGKQAGETAKTFEIRLGVETAFEFNDKPHTFAFEVTPKGLDRQKIGQEVAHNVLAIWDENSDSKSVSPQFQKKLSQNDPQQLETVLANLIASALDPSVQKVSAEQVAAILSDTQAQKAFLASQSIPEFSTNAPTLVRSANEVISLENHGNIKDTCLIGKQTAECIFPYGFFASTNQKLSSRLPDNYLIEEILPLYQEHIPGAKVAVGKKTDNRIATTDMKKLFNSPTYVFACQNLEPPTGEKGDPCLIPHTLQHSTISKLTFKKAMCPSAIKGYSGFKYGVFEFSLLPQSTGKQAGLNQGRKLFGLADEGEYA